MLHQRCAALDIGKEEVVCCVRVPDPGSSGQRLQEVTTHRTMVRSLLMLCDQPSDDQREQAEEAVTSCPTEALSLHELS